MERRGHVPGLAHLLWCCARLALARARPEQAVRLAAAAAALREARGDPLSPAERSRWEESLAPARQALRGAGSAQAWAEGETLELERAVAAALDATEADVVEWRARAR
jgi:hypothetical protein